MARVTCIQPASCTKAILEMDYLFNSHRMTLTDVDIPDDIGKEESSLTFGALKSAQAKGDWQALIDKGRRIIRFHFQENSAAGLRNLAKLI